MSNSNKDVQTRQNIAENLCRILHDRRLNQASLAKLTGDTEMTISRICRAKCTPGVGIIARIAESLDISMDRLTGIPQKKVSESA